LSLKRKGGREGKTEEGREEKAKYMLLLHAEWTCVTPAVPLSTLQMVTRLAIHHFDV
jgi:hypothetical protein